MENKELKEVFIDEKTGIEYVKQGDYIGRIMCIKYRKFIIAIYNKLKNL